METYANIKGQVTIPAALRRKYGIKNGTKIIVTDIGNGIVLKPITGEYQSRGKESTPSSIK